MNEIESITTLPPPHDLDTYGLVFWYEEQADACEKTYQFDVAIAYLKLRFAEEYKHYQLVFDQRMSKRYQLKYLTYKAKGSTADFYYQFNRIAALYLKMGTSYLRDYWVSLQESPYYEDGSFFKDMVERGILLAEEKQAQGYVYKPATKANREIFLAYAKEKGWR